MKTLAELSQQHTAAKEALVKRALVAAKYNATHAAIRLDVSRQTILQYIRKNPELNAQYRKLGTGIGRPTK